MSLVQKMVVHSTWEVEAGGSQEVWHQPGLYRKTVSKNQKVRGGEGDGDKEGEGGAGRRGEERRGRKKESNRNLISFRDSRFQSNENFIRDKKKHYM
jgi:hypothetical protein